MANFLFIHGSWHGSWCWEPLRPLMEERGHRISTPDLPAHGEDRSGRLSASLRTYAERISNAAAAFDEPVIAVGHSMGGMVLKQAITDTPLRFRAAVYLCAFVPLHGESLVSLARQDPGSLVPASTWYGGRGMSVRQEKAGNLFYADCSQEDSAWAVSRLQIEPYRPLFGRFKENGTIEVPSTYIGCSEDRVISPNRQRVMASRSGIEMFATMRASHSPFLSAPEELADLLTRYAAVIGEQAS